MSCCDSNTFTLAFMLLAVILGSTAAQETGEEECHHMESTAAPIEGKPTKMRGLYGIIDEELVANSSVWRIICPYRHTILTVVFRVNTSNGEYLQVKRKQLEGCVEFPMSYHFTKKSILVAVASSTNGTANSSTFQLGYVCVGSSSSVLANQIFFCDEALQYLHTHGTAAFSEAAELVAIPESILDAYTKKHSPKFLQMIDVHSGICVEPSTAPATEDRVSPAPRGASGTDS